MKYIVKTFAVIFYGQINKAKIVLNVGQKWELLEKPSMPYVPWYTLERHGVTIDIVPEDFERLFREDGKLQAS